MKHIPAVMHHIWIGPRDLPDEFGHYRAEWVRLHPGWDHRWWGNHNAEAQLTVLRPLWDDAARIAPNSVEQFRSDLLRYELLLQFGGVYVDADLEPRRNVYSLLEGERCVLAWEEDGVWLNNAFMAAAPGHPFIERIVKRLPKRVEWTSGRGYRPNKISGPQYITPIYEADRDGITVLDSALFYPYLYNQLERGGEDFPGAYAVHHWNNRRRLLAEAAKAGVR